MRVNVKCDQVCEFLPVQYVGVHGKPKIRFGLKSRTIQKFDIHSDSFPTETACSPQFKL